MKYLKPLLIALSIGLNCVAVAALVWVVMTPLYEVRPVVREMVEDVHRPFMRFTRTAPARPSASDEVVFLGDSITASAAWSDLFPGVAVSNHGVAGDTAARVLDRLEPLTASRPEAIFLLVGTNDLQSGFSLDEIGATVGVILARINSHSPETRIFVQSVLPRGPEYRERVESLNRRLEGTVAQYRARWVDLYPSFVDADDGSMRSELAIDGLHLSARGYEVWREQITPYVASLPIADRGPASPPRAGD